MIGENEPRSVIVLADDSYMYLSGIINYTNGFFTLAERIYKFGFDNLLIRDFVLAMDSSFSLSRTAADLADFDVNDKNMLAVLELHRGVDIYSVFDVVHIYEKVDDLVEIMPYRKLPEGGGEGDLDLVTLGSRSDLLSVAVAVVAMFDDRSKFLPLARARKASMMNESVSKSISLKVGVRVKDVFGNLGKIVFIDKDAENGLGLVVVQLDDGRVIRTAVFANGLSIVE